MLTLDPAESRPGRVAAVQVLVIATLLGLIASGQHNIVMRSDGGPTDLWHALGMGMPYWYAWALFIPIVAAAARRWPITRSEWIRRGLIHVPIALALTFVHSWVEIVVQGLLGIRHAPLPMLSVMSVFRSLSQLPYNLSAAGIGLRNIRARLEHLYGGAQGLTLSDAPGGGALATVTLPFRTTPR